MAERIKGLQIDLSMRDMGVAKTLAGVKREFRSLNSSLKISESNFKYSEKTADSYKSRMSELDKAIKVGTSNLDELEKQYHEVAQTQGANSASAVRLKTEYNKQANSINYMKDQLSKLDDEYARNYSTLGRAGGVFNRMSESLQNTSDKAGRLGASLTSSITKPALIAGTAMAGITAKLGFDRLVGLDTAKAKLEGLGYSTKEVGSITDQVTNAIKGGMTTMAEGTDIAAGALAAGVKEGKELEHYIKLVGDAAVGANRPVGDMAMIFNRVQGTGKLMTQELNMIEEGMPGFANAMAKSLGVSQEEFRKMVTEGEVSSKQFLDVMDDFAGGMASAYSKSWKGMVQNTKAYIGIIGENLLSGVFKESKESLAQFEKLLSSPQAVAWAERTGQAIGTGFSGVVNAIKSAVGWWNSLGGTTQKVLGGTVKWLAITLITIGPVLTIFSKFTGIIAGMFGPFGRLLQTFGAVSAAAGKTGSIIQGVSAVFPKLGMAMTFFTGPVGIAVAAIAGLAVAFTIAYKKSETFRNIVNGALHGVVVAFQFLWNGIKAIGSAIAEWWNSPDGIGGVFSSFWKENGPQFMQALNNIKTGILIMFNFIKPILMAIGQIFKFTFSVMLASVKFFMPVITGIFKVGWAVIKYIFSSTLDSIKGLIKGALDVIIGIAKIFIGLFTGDFRKMWEGIKQLFFGALKFIWNLVNLWFVGKIFGVFKLGLGLIKGVVKGSMGSVKNIFSTVLKFIWGIAKSIFGKLSAFMRNIFGGIVKFTRHNWNLIKLLITNPVKGTYKLVTSTFRLLSKIVKGIFSGLAKVIGAIWRGIKKTVTGLAKGLYAVVKNRFELLRKTVTTINRVLGNVLKNIWQGIKKKTSELVGGLVKNTKSKYNNMKSSVAGTLKKIGSNSSNSWKNIKKNTVDLASSMKSKVTGVFGKMRDSLKNIIGKIGDHIGGMVKGVKSGLNKLIKGVNWVGDKLGMKKLPEIKLHTGTESTHTRNFVTNGKINRDTFATVGDKGKGNGPNGFRHEAIEYPNGKMALTPNTDTTAFLPKGSKVYNGMQTHSMLNGMPKFSFGTNPLGNGNPKPKKKKKGDNVFGDAWDATKAGAAKVVDGGKAVVSKVGETVGKGKKWLEDKIGDVNDWMDKPKQLLDKVLEGFGLNLDGFGIPKKAKLPYDMMKGMFSNLKKAAVDKIKQAFEEQEGDGDGGYIDLWRGINFGFHPTASSALAAGYPFARAHHGIDVNYPYGTKVRSTVSGKATGTHGYNGGFGNMMKIVSGAIEVIYGHMSKLNWTGAKQVKPGSVLGLSGGDPARQGAGAGSSTGPHLHYEMRWNGVAKDPVPWLKKNNGSGKGGSQNKAASKWKGDIKRAAKQMKVNLSNAELNGIVAQIQRESNGNAGVTQGNIGDINNLRGTPAQGLLQYVPSTFDSYKLKGYGNIKNGYHQLLAFFNNANWRRDLPYGRSGWSPSGSRRFASGGLINTSGWYNLAEGGYPEFVIPTDPSMASDAMKLLAIASERVSQRAKNNKRPNQLRMPHQNNTQDRDMFEMMAQQLEATQEQNSLLKQLLASNRNIEKQPKGFNTNDVNKSLGQRAEMMAYNLGGAY